MHGDAAHSTVPDLSGGAWLDADDDAAPCSVCGGPLTGDPDDVAEGVPGGPMCGECHRAREFDQTIWEWDPDEGG
ncbi:MAG: hypothetical protein H0W07_07320 [Chloroflexi bacterium]|nr:hypothetical protein [Chloroflexota bacterium]